MNQDVFEEKFEQQTQKLKEEHSKELQDCQHQSQNRVIKALSDHKKDLKMLNSAHKEELRKKDEAHAEEVENLVEKHRRELADQHAGYVSLQNRTPDIDAYVSEATLVKKHRQGLTKKRAEYVSTESAYKEAMQLKDRAHAEDIEKLEEKHRQELTDKLAKYVSMETLQQKDKAHAEDIKKLVEKHQQELADERAKCVSMKSLEQQMRDIHSRASESATSSSVRDLADLVQESKALAVTHHEQTCRHVTDEVKHQINETQEGLKVDAFPQNSLKVLSAGNQ
ncbi:hypothetical protein BDV96DRAFT_655075 [Lophiotrema nucula]|uniref:Uncharacterized protein n=1 Tax=Lophiotrema nucula TaxID=690887 RepID=A0A6A5YGJ4_9PLEO|nr:hypothetical protein BDV96DRAFT_655075 [Lophiotrema nucula]